MTTGRHRSPIPWVNYSTEEQLNFIAACFRTPQPLSFCLCVTGLNAVRYLQHELLILINPDWPENQKLDGTLVQCKQFLCDSGTFVWSWKKLSLEQIFEFPDYLAGELLKRGYKNSSKATSTCLVQSIEQLAPTEQEQQWSENVQEEYGHVRPMGVAVLWEPESSVLNWNREGVVRTKSKALEMRSGYKIYPQEGCWKL